MNNELDQDIQQYQQLLKQSSKDLDPAIKARLNEARQNAVNSLDDSPGFARLFWQPALALSIPIIAIASLFIFSEPDQYQQASSDFYADLEILMDEEEQLDFLADMEISQWIESENEG